jgi:hypothetical protein
VQPTGGAGSDTIQHPNLTGTATSTGIGTNVLNGGGNGDTLSGSPGDTLISIGTAGSTRDRLRA